MKDSLSPEVYAKLKHFADEGDVVATGILSSVDGSPILTSVRCVSTSLPNTPTYSAGVFTAGANAALSLDSKTMALNDRFLRVQGDSHDGIYVVTNIGAAGGGGHPWTAKRSVEINATAEFRQGLIVSVWDGTTYVNSLWELTLPSSFVMDTGTPLFTQFATGVSASAVLSALALAASSVSVNSQKITNLATPTASTDAATKAYVDGLKQAGAVMWTPPAAETTFGAATLVTDVAITAVALTIAAQPAVPCKLNIIKTDADNSYAATLTIVGVGPGGEAIASEVIALLAVDGSHTYVTANAYSKITSATVSALSGNGASDHIAIGQASALGLPIPSTATSVVIYKEAVGATVASVPVNENVGTVDATARTVIPTTAANGTKALSFWYSYLI